MADANALRRATQSFGSDTAQNLNALQRAGLFSQAAAYQKQIQDAQKTQSEIGLNTSHAGKFDQDVAASKQDQAIKAHEKHLQQLQGVTSPDQFMQWLSTGVGAGAMTLQGAAGIGQKLQQDPTQFEAIKQKLLQSGVALVDRFKQEQENARNTATNATHVQTTQMTNDTSRANTASNNATSIKTTGMNNATSMANTATTNATTQRGQNLTDARSRETIAAAMTKPFEVSGPDGAPQLVQMNKKGDLQKVEGFGPKAGAKPLNEGQAKALGYGTRMQESAKILGQLDGKYSPAGINAKIGAENSFVGSIAGPVANSMLSDQSQQAEQAQRDFVNAVLRRESGAAISASEFDNARKQYFNQPGDSKAVKDQKARNRDLAISGVLAEVPPALRASITPAQTATASTNADVPPEIAAILKKHGVK